MCQFRAGFLENTLKPNMLFDDMVYLPVADDGYQHTVPKSVEETVTAVLLVRSSSDPGSGCFEPWCSAIHRQA